MGQTRIPSCRFGTSSFGGNPAWLHTAFVEKRHGPRITGSHLGTVGTLQASLDKTNSRQIHSGAGWLVALPKRSREAGGSEMDSH